MLKNLTGYLLWAALVQAAYAAPYIPGSPNQVLEKLPATTDASIQRFKSLRSRLASDPKNSELAVKLTKLYIEQSRDEGDPRYLGYAQAALAPWWELDQPPIDILVLRATLLQSTHQFDESLADLNRVLKLDRANGQAWLTRATIQQVQGKYAEALQSCEQLYALTSELVTLTCSLNVRNLNGRAKDSYQELKVALEQTPDTDPNIQIWVLTLLAEMAERLGDVVAAEKHFENAINLGDPDSYLLGVYSDFLLEQHRPQEVLSLLKAKTTIDPLLLRYAEALNAMHLPESQVQIEELRNRFDAAMMRGDTVHQREQSRFELRLMHNPVRALEIAKLNWAIQKEPADARVYLEAALASSDKYAAVPLIGWLEAHHLEDAILKKMIDHHKGAI